MMSSAIVKFSGQVGWDETGKLEVNNLERHVDLAFKNVDRVRVLQAAALRGWEDVYSARSYHVDMSTSFNIFVVKLRQYLPGHMPIWT
jgi:enamine deaminase RidA (YjgF/YER057c/UK114 family)